MFWHGSAFELSPAQFTVALGLRVGILPEKVVLPDGSEAAVPRSDDPRETPIGVAERLYKDVRAMERALELPEGALAVTWKSLREVGNLSSTSVLLVLRETFDHHRPPPGSYGMLLAMGPGFCSELVLLEW